MFRSDARPLRPAGPTELPPYYAQRLQAVEPPGVRSARHAAAGSPEAEAERLFRDFKLGLLTLVIISLLLLAYFWDGGDGGARTGDEPDDVLAFWVTARRRGDVLPYAAEAVEVSRAVRRTGARGVVSRGSTSPARAVRPRTRPSTSSGRGRREPVERRARAYVYKVRSGDTLSAIALRFYGDASLWKAILRANSGRLRRASDLRAGMRLIVPLRSRRAGVVATNANALALAGPVRRE